MEAFGFEEAGEVFAGLDAAGAGEDGPVGGVHGFDFGDDVVPFFVGGEEVLVGELLADAGLVGGDAGWAGRIDYLIYSGGC